MTISTIAIVFAWAASLILGLLGLADPTASMCKPNLPSNMAPFVLLMPFVVFGFAALIAKGSPFLVPKFAASITARTGRPSYETFLVRFKPMLFFGSSSILGGLSELRSCFQSEGSVGISAHGWFFVAGGAAFLLMHGILKLRKVPGV
jgi:hypothetical protein